MPFARGRAERGRKSLIVWIMNGSDLAVVIVAAAAAVVSGEEGRREVAGFG